MTKRNPEFGGFSACFAVRTETDRKGKATPPARTETSHGTDCRTGFAISTHSAREDGDYAVAAASFWKMDFNPLRPRGRRLAPKCGSGMTWVFQPTPPARTETSHGTDCRTGFAISTHSAREDGDYAVAAASFWKMDFNPLRPRGRRLNTAISFAICALFQPTPPARTETTEE